MDLKYVRTLCNDGKFEDATTYLSGMDDMLDMVRAGKIFAECDQEPNWTFIDGDLTDIFMYMTVKADDVTLSEVGFQYLPTILETTIQT